MPMSGSSQQEVLSRNIVAGLHEASSILHKVSRTAVILQKLRIFNPTCLPQLVFPSQDYVGKLADTQGDITDLVSQLLREARLIQEELERLEMGPPKGSTGPEPVQDLMGEDVPSFEVGGCRAGQVAGQDFHLPPPIFPSQVLECTPTPAALSFTSEESDTTSATDSSISDGVIVAPQPRKSWDACAEFILGIENLAESMQSMEESPESPSPISLPPAKPKPDPFFHPMLKVLRHLQTESGQSAQMGSGVLVKLLETPGYYSEIAAEHQTFREHLQAAKEVGLVELEGGDDLILPWVTVREGVYDGDEL